MPDYMIGDVTVTPETGEVSRAGEVVHLEPKSMAVLLRLIEHSGEVVSREDLLDAVWPGIHVGDDSLTAAIIKIRRALGDDARNPTHVETIPKRGYRLVAEVRRAAVETPPARNPGRRWWPVAILFAMILLAASAAVIWLRPAPIDTVNAPPQRDDKITIAVAPFENFGQDPAQDYLAAGIGESLLTDLAQVPEFSVRRVRSDEAGARDVEYVLEGSVLHAGELVRIDARLVDAERGTVLSALRFDRPFADLLTIEDEIGDTVLDTLKGSISTAERSRRARGYTENIHAYDLFLRAQAKLLIRTEETNRAARNLYLQAISTDANFARAYGGLALTFAAEYRNGWSDDPGGALGNAEKYARTAISLSPDLPEQHWVIGYVRAQERSFDQARDELQKAIDLDPGFADAYALSGGIETYRENPKASVPLLRQAMRLNPDAGYLYFLLLARAYYFLGDFEQAGFNLDEALTRNPENLEAHLYLAATLLNLGSADDASWEAMEVLNLESDFSLEQWSETYPMQRGKQMSRLLSDLRQIGVP